MELVGNAIGDILAGTSGVTSLLASTDHIYDGLVIQVDAPKIYLRYFIVDVDPQDTKDGPATLDVYIIEVDVFAEDPQDCANLAKEVREALDRYTPSTVNGISINGIRYEGGAQMPEMADAVDKHAYTLMFKVRVNRS